MESVKLRLFKIQVCLIFLFIIGGNSSAQITAPLTLPLQLTISCSDIQYNFRTQIIIVLKDGSENQIFIEKHQNELKSDWITSIEQEVVEIHFKVLISTDKIWEWEKSILHYTLVPSSAFNTFKIVLSGSYTNPEVKKKFLKFTKV